MGKTGRIVGIIASIVSMVLWGIFNFFNPYSPGVSEMGPMINTLLLLFLPACLAMAGAIMNKKMYMLIAFIWSLPISFYMMLTPSIFQLFGWTCLLYGISFLFMLVSMRKVVE